MTTAGEFLLTDDEFEALSEADQSLYLDVLAAEAAEWKLSPRQQEAEQLALEVDEILYGGAAGGGKSEWIMWHILHLSQKYPGHVTLVLRRVLPELRRTLIRRSILLFATLDATERPIYKVASKEWHFPNGSVIEFGHCENDDDVRTYLSAEYDCIAIDEASEFSAEQLELLGTRYRCTAAKSAMGIKPHMILTTNPGGRGHGHLKRDFVTATDYGAHIAVTDIVMPDNSVETRTRAFVKSTVHDNPHMPKAYIVNLMSRGEKIRRQYLDGDWDMFEGQYFVEFERAVHVIPPFEIPHEWPRFRAIDYGYTAPFCCLWFTVDADGQVYVYREAYEVNLTPKEQAKLISTRSLCTTAGITAREKTDYTKGDPSMWSSHTGLSVAAQYRQGNVYLAKAENDRLAGWARVREYLRLADMERPVYRRTSDDDEEPENRPGVEIFSTCENLVRSIPLMIHAKHKPEDLDTTLEDHAVDALRYGLMSRPRRFVVASKEPETVDERIKAHLDELVKRQRKHRHHPELGRLP